MPTTENSSTKRRGFDALALQPHEVVRHGGSR